MAVTDTQYQALATRVANLEKLLSNVLVAIQNFVTSNQVRQLRLLTETDVDDLKTRVAALERQLDLLVNDPES